MLAGLMDYSRMVIEQLISLLGYPGIFILMVVENLAPPIPSELVMPFSGFLVSNGDLSLPWILVSGTLGAVVGAVIIYSLGTRVSEIQVRRWVDQYGAYMFLSGSDYERAMGFFRKYGYAAVFFGRFVPGVRSLISIPAGMQRMNFFQYIVLTSLGTFGWNLLLTYAGTALGANWQVVLRWIDRYEHIIWSLIIVGIFFILTRKVKEKVQVGKS